MSQERTPMLERLLERAARRLAAAGLHPLQLRDRILEEFERSVRDGDAPNEVRVSLHPRDYARLAPELPAFRAEMLQLLFERSRVAGYRSIGKRRLHFETNSTLPVGTVQVAAKFAHAPVAGGVARAAAVTRRLVPVRDLTLRLPGGERIAVTHFPWRIGRGPDNDLVLASMAVSRHHAELNSGEGGIVIRDMKSRNGIMVDGRPCHQAELEPGTVFTIGDIDLRLEGARD